MEITDVMDDIFYFVCVSLAFKVLYKACSLFHAFFSAKGGLFGDDDGDDDVGKAHLSLSLFFCKKGESPGGGRLLGICPFCVYMHSMACGHGRSHLVRLEGYFGL